MDTNELKRLLQSWADKLREQKDVSMTRRIALIAISAVLAYLGINPFG